MEVLRIFSSEDEDYTLYTISINKTAKVKMKTLIEETRCILNIKKVNSNYLKKKKPVNWSSNQIRIILEVKTGQPGQRLIVVDVCSGSSKK